MRVPNTIAALLLGVSISIAQTSAPMRWAEGAPNATSDMKNDTKIEGFKTDSVHIFVNLAEIKDTEYNRVWIQVTNPTKEPLVFDPQSAVLVNDEKGKTIPAEAPDKAAKSVQKYGEAKSQELSSAHCNQIAAVQCQPTNAQMQMSKQVAAATSHQAQWVRENGLTKKTLAPGEEEQGAIVFKKDKKAANYLFRVSVGSQVFEFPVRGENRLPSYD